MLLQLIVLPKSFWMLDGEKKICSAYNGLLALKYGMEKKPVTKEKRNKVWVCVWIITIFIELNGKWEWMWILKIMCNYLRPRYTSAVVVFDAAAYTIRIQRNYWMCVRNFDEQNASNNKIRFWSKHWKCVIGLCVSLNMCLFECLSVWFRVGREWDAQKTNLTEHYKFEKHFDCVHSRYFNWTTAPLVIHRQLKREWDTCVERKSVSNERENSEYAHLRRWGNKC